MSFVLLGSLLSAQVLWQIRFERHSKRSSSHAATSTRATTPQPHYPPPLLFHPTPPHKATTYGAFKHSGISEKQSAVQPKQVRGPAEMWKWQCNLFFSSSTKGPLPPTPLPFLPLPLSIPIPTPEIYHSASPFISVLVFFSWGLQLH